MNVLGIMSGTSLGSVDYALCAINGDRVKLKELWAVDYPKDLQRKLHAAARGDMKSWEFCQVHHDLGRFYAEHARHGKIKPQLVGVHGQTVFHNPSPKAPATFQMGESVYLSETLKVPVVNNFRVADLACGGQGAPLATVFHKIVFGKPGKRVCVNNLGGISNVTSIDGKGRRRKPRILAFDTGPANMLVDFAIRHFSGGKLEYDADGAWAARGTASEDLLKKWMKHPYLTMKPPKSTGRELFGEPFFKEALGGFGKISKYDVVATFAEFTARSLALNYKLHLESAPDEVILAGGGASNPVLVQKIRTQLQLLFGSTVEVTTSDRRGWGVQAIEPAAFALLAYLRFTRKPGNIPETTGARRPVLCGQVAG